jgi:hypothetical protein
MRPTVMILAASAVLVAPLAAQSVPDNERSVATIAGSPLHDVGIKKTIDPPALLKIRDRPYAIDGLKDCKAIAAAVIELDEALGRDVDQPSTGKKPSETTELSMDAGQDTINSLIPGRFIIRRLSGATDARRKAVAAVYAGSIRRGFLKGLGAAKGCKPPAAPLAK